MKGKNNSHFALRNRPRQGQKGGSEAGKRESEWSEPLFSIRMGCQGEEGMPQNSPLPLLKSRVFNFFSLNLNLGTKKWNLGLSEAMGEVVGTGLCSQFSLSLTNHSGHLNTGVQITKISNGIIILDKLKMLLSPLEQPENRTIHWLNFNGTIKEQLIPQHGVPLVGNYRVRNAPSLRWPDWCKVPRWFKMFVKLAIVCTRIYPISQK